jgi:hypothetical protein
LSQIFENISDLILISGSGNGEGYEFWFSSGSCDNSCGRDYESAHMRVKYMMGNAFVGTTSHQAKIESEVNHRHSKSKMGK